MSQYDEFTLDSRFLEYLHAAQNFKLTDRQQQYFNMRFGLSEDGHEARFHVYKEIAKSFRVTQPTVSSRLKVCKEKLKTDAYLEIKSGITNPNTRFILYLHNIFNIKYPGNIDYIMSLVDREDSYLYQKENFALLIIYFLYDSDYHLFKSIRSSRNSRSSQIHHLMESTETSDEARSDEDSAGVFEEEFTSSIVLPEEITEEALMPEGAKIQISINSYERNAQARDACVEYYGSSCYVCCFNFKTVFGDIGDGFIHVHHLIPLSEIEEEYTVNPIRDLRPVCPNCHAMLHKRKPPYTVEELQRILSNRQ